MKTAWFASGNDFIPSGTDVMLRVTDSGSLCFLLKNIEEILASIAISITDFGWLLTLNEFLRFF